MGDDGGTCGDVLGFLGDGAGAGNKSLSLCGDGCEARGESLGSCSKVLDAGGGGLGCCGDGFGDAAILSAVGAVKTMAAMKKMIVDRRAGGGDFIDETKAALLRAVMGVGFTGWHKLPTTNLVVELLMM